VPSAVNCSRCDAKIGVPARGAGPVVRCPRCGARNPLDDWDRPRGGVPVWAWVTGGVSLVVVALIALGLALQNRHRDDDPADRPGNDRAAGPDGVPETGGETWVRRTHDASGAAWEFPTTGESSPTNSVVRLADQKPIGFSVTIKDVPERDRKPHLHPLDRLRAARPGGGSGFGPVESTRVIDGRPAVVVRAQNYAALIAADHERTYEFNVSMPQRDEGGLRVNRFFDSVRITRPMPSEPAAPSTGGPGGGVLAGGEAIPPGWDRVQVPRTQMTLLMPKGPAPAGARGDFFPGFIPVSRGLALDGDDVAVSAASVEPTPNAPAVGGLEGLVDFLKKGIKDQRQLVVSGYRADRVHYVMFGSSVVYQMIYLDGSGVRYVMISVAGGDLNLDSPVVKRVFDSVSFSLPAKRGPEAPEDLTPPQWTRRFVDGTDFSVEMPGRAKTGAGVALGPAMAWGSHGFVPLPGRKRMEFVTAAVGIAAPNRPDPRRTIELEIQGLGLAGNQNRLVRRVELAGRPGFVAARVDKNGNGFVQMKVQDAVMQYTLTVGGPGVTPDTPAVKRFLDSASFTALPDGAGKGGGPKWTARALEGSGLTVAMPPAPPGGAPEPKGPLGPTAIQYGQAPDGKGGVLTFTAFYVGARRPTDPGPPDDVGKRHILDNTLAVAKALPDAHRIVAAFLVHTRPAVAGVTGEKAGGVVAVWMEIQEGDRLYTLRVEGRGISEKTPEVVRFMTSARFAEAGR
jgi:hypothetical protein